MSESPRSASTYLYVAVPALAIIGLLALLVFLWHYSPDEKAPPQAIAAPEIPKPLAQTRPAEPAIVEVEPASASEPDPQPDEPPLPKLNESDAELASTLSGLEAGPAIDAILDREEIARKFVRAVYNIHRGIVVQQHRPIVSPDPSFAAVKIGVGDPQHYVIASKNAARYTKYVDLFAALDKAAVASLYRRYLPLLEQAFGELGLPDQNFHQIFVGAIDSLLMAPSLPEDDKVLVRPSVMYKFADPKLEALPATHKLLLRMGNANAESLKQSLRALRAEI